jgi:hypothetical protein
MEWIFEVMCIGKEDWSFRHISEVDQERAGRLEAALESDQLVEALARSLNTAIEDKSLRIAVDSKNNAFTERRTILQFPVLPVLYDWFFNARSGYRSRFWIGPKTGLAFNAEIMAALKHAVGQHLASIVEARRIEVIVENGSRTEKDTGTIDISREEIMKSLWPIASKIWVCERLYSRGDGSITDIGFAVLSDAERNLPKLAVTRWAEAINPETKQRGEGQRAPYPTVDAAWLDIKGGFLDANGNADQIKPQDNRARRIHEIGWT